MTQTSWDYIIVGGGAAGCVVANRLSSDGNHRVLLLEAGAPDTAPTIHDPGGFVSLWASDLDWKLTTEPQAGQQGREILINQGKVMGGSTSINALMWVRGNRRNFDRWAEQGATGWSYADLLPTFMAVEDYAGGASEVHGVGGPMSVVDNPDPNSGFEPFMQGAMELGFDGPYWDINGDRQENGAGLLQFSLTPAGKRASAVVSYLDPVRSRSNLTVETGALATKILFEGTRAVGVEYSQGGEIKQALAGKEIVSCAGAFLSPKLLLLSGVGPAADLEKLGIPVVADLPGVGENLQDHLQLPVVFTSKKPRETPGLLTGNVLFVNTRKDDVDSAPDLQLNFTPAVPGPLAPVLNIPIPVGIFLPILVQPLSRGTVKLRSADPTDPPVIDPHYLENPADVQTLVDAIGLIRKLAVTAALIPEYETEIVPGADADVEGYIRGGTTTIWHPVGTCRMGQDPLAVVSPQLLVHGVQGLRVADASVMPEVTSGNTQAACFVIGEKAASFILSDN